MIASSLSKQKRPVVRAVHVLIKTLTLSATGLAHLNVGAAIGDQHSCSWPLAQDSRFVDLLAVPARSLMAAVVLGCELLYIALPHLQHAGPDMLEMQSARAVHM